MTKIIALPRLTAILDCWRDASLIWLAAPCGYGKSSLLEGYLEQSAASTLWYRASPSDSGIRSLFEAIDPTHRAKFPQIANALRVHEWDTKPIVRTGRELLSEIVAANGGAANVVIDNYHLVSHLPALDDLLVHVIGEIPGLRLFVASRLSPPSVFARHQVHGSIKVLSLTDLRLTLEDHRWLVSELSLASDIAMSDELHALTAGWPAAARLLAGSLLANEHSAERRLLNSYIHQELFHNVPAEHRASLCTLSLFDEFDSAMAQQLLSQLNTDLLLHNLEQQLYLIEKNTMSGRWRFHPLVRAFLRNIGLVEIAESERRHLTQLAAQVLLTHGEIARGFELLIQTRNFGLIEAGLNAHARAWLDQGNHARLFRWLAPLLDASYADGSWLSYWFGVAMLPRDPAQALDHFQRAYQRFVSDQELRGQLLASSGAIEALFLDYHHLNALDVWLQRAEAASHLVDELALPEQERVICVLFGGLVFRQQAHPRLPAWRERALKSIVTSNDASLRVYVATAAIMHFVWSGDYARARVVAERCRPELDSESIAPLARASAWLALAVLIGNEPTPSPDYAVVENGLAAAQKYDVHIWDAEIYGQGAVIALSANDLGIARRYLDQMRALLPRAGGVHAAGYHCFSAWWYLLADDLAQAREHVESARAAAQIAGTLPLRRHTRVINSLLLARENRLALARAELAEMQADELIENHPRGPFSRLLIESHLHLCAHDKSAAVACLRAALPIGREWGYVNFYGWSPHVVAPLMECALEAGIEVEYARMLVERRNLIPRKPPWNIPSWPWPLRIYTLGKVSLESSNIISRRSSKTAQKPIELILALVAYGGRQVASSRLTDVLWPEAEGDAARQSFTVTLHRARALVGREDALVLENSRLTLNQCVVWTDVWAVSALLQRMASIADNDHAQLCNAFQQVLELYQGPFLIDQELSNASVQRERLRRQVVRQCVRLLTNTHSRDELSTASDLSAKLLDVEPCAEEVADALIRRYLAVDDAPAAVAVFERLERSLRRERGTSPPQALRDALPGAPASNRASRIR